MARVGEKALSRGALLFAFNSQKKNYYRIAEYSAKRIQNFLKLPVTLVTDKQSLPKTQAFQFDNIIIIDADKTNKKSGEEWINKGRYQAYDLSPYDETLLLDVDYLVNSDKLLKAFDTYKDFCCHQKVNFLMQSNTNPILINEYGLEILWATVVLFRKTERAKKIFQCMEMIQKNFQHYSCLHDFAGKIYRNDYAITLALRIVNGHCILPGDIIPWNLIHVGNNTTVYKNKNDSLNTEFTVLFDRWNKRKLRKEYIIIKDMDFHILNKNNLMDIIENE